MQAIVLVGGEGTRLRPLTYGTPKPMVPIMNVPFLARTMERLYEAGIRDVILPAGYMPQAIVDYFGDGSRLDMNITYVIEETPLGTAGALKNVEQHITGRFFVLNGDVLTSLDLRAMLRYHDEKGGVGALHLIRVDDPSSFGCVVHDGGGRVSAFVEKPPRGEEPTNEINAGTYLLEREILNFIPAGRNVSIERETFPKVIAAGKDLYAYTTADYWIDLGRPENYLAAHRDVLSGAMPLTVEPGISGNGGEALKGHPGVVPPVHADEDVVVDASAKVGPNVVLGRGCSIGANAVVRESVLWERVSVGSGATIEEAILASGATIGPKAQIGRGSVIGHDVSVDPGQVLEPGSRLGPPVRA
ncbi:MAG: NDP-sugar synthase [Candidatus Eremiobacteraeota bacterium]|nr:NDP-sugar synthase [Candidatus Eremiobacteraeota bacterium]MBV8433510.1 NDP-sugar synthase [Candidatus Eremiobacteraeota bacterium]MBV8582450.1 NDP-sugar synthase [Candidatus Eremiobacteraeota bacterium]